MARRIRPNSSVLSMAIAHTQTEQMISPIITALTIQCACQNRLNSERSEEVSPICGRSAGFIAYPFGSPDQGLRLAALSLGPIGAPGGLTARCAEKTIAR